MARHWTFRMSGRIPGILYLCLILIPLDCHAYIAAAAGNGAANPPWVTILDDAWNVTGTFPAFDVAGSGFGGQVAMGDIDGDGVTEVVVAKGLGPGYLSEVKVFNRDGVPLSGANAIAFPSAWGAGTSVAAEDFDGDGDDEIVVGTASGSSLVRILAYDAANRRLLDTGAAFQAFPGAFQGVTLAVADIDGGAPEIITGSGRNKNSPPDVAVWNISTGGGIGNWTIQPHAGFSGPAGGILPGTSDYGASVAAGSGRVVVASGVNQGTVEAYTASGSLLCNASGIDPSGSTRLDGGINVALADGDGDSQVEIVVTLGATPLSDSRVILLDSTTCLFDQEVVAEVLPGVRHGLRLAWGRADDEVAYFRFDEPHTGDTFVFKLTDPATIQQARDILNLPLEWRTTHVGGNVLSVPASYNPPWSFHLDPASIRFWELSIEVCDSSIQGLEDHLASFCAQFAPGPCQWCPWSSRLIEEVFP